MATDKNTIDCDDDNECVVITPMERAIDALIYNSRWLLLPVFVGLIIALAAFALSFIVTVFDFSLNVLSYDKDDMLLMLLTFVDKVLVAGLIVMVLIGGYENFVGKVYIAAGKNRLSWLGKVGSGSLKVKLATSIVSISSIHLLKIFLDVKKFTITELAWTTGIHFVMVITALLLVLMDRIQPSK